MPQIEAGTRMRVAKFLPKALETAIASYHKFSRQEVEQAAVEFKKHHDACKVAIAHIELLVKLAKWAHLPDSKVADELSQNELKNMIEIAQGELNDFKGD